MLSQVVRYDERSARRQAVRYAAMAAVFGLGFPLAAWFGYSVGVPTVLIVVLIVMAVAGTVMNTYLARNHVRERARYEWLAFELTPDGIRLPVLAEPERKIVADRQSIGIPHGLVHGHGLPISFGEAVHRIRDAATGHGVPVRTVENLRDR